ncbi:MAG: methyltransferase domain-containing protein [Anaerolineae bacterium]|nr:methyltransferase domain-containing protein [Anaerolineae bacterium]
MNDPSPSTFYRLPSTWDERYATFGTEDRREPSRFVAACLPHLPSKGYALDIAAGVGRHSIALAQHGLHVDAVDRSRQGLRLAQQRAVEAGLKPGKDLYLIMADLERPWLPRRDYEVILVSFFLCRPLFPMIKAQLRPGGWLVYETLTIHQTFGAGRQPARPDFLLQPQELKDAFADFELVFYDEVNQNQRTTAQLLARKKVTGYR